VLARLREENRLDDAGFGLRPMVVIHTVALLRSPADLGSSAARRMQRLAEENGGVYRPVPRAASAGR
jgi:hypothetical protein